MACCPFPGPFGLYLLALLSSVCRVLAVMLAHRWSTSTFPNSHSLETWHCRCGLFQALPGCSSEPWMCLLRMLARMQRGSLDGWSGTRLRTSIGVAEVVWFLSPDFNQNFDQSPLVRSYSTRRQTLFTYPLDHYMFAMSLQCSTTAIRQ